MVRDYETIVRDQIGFLYLQVCKLQAEKEALTEEVTALSNSKLLVSSGATATEMARSEN